MKRKGYIISQAVEMTGTDEVTLLSYEREGLIEPLIEEGERFYTDEHIEKVMMIKRLTDDLGVNMAGVEVILNMREQMLNMQSEFEKIIDEMKLGILKELNDYESRLRRPRIESKAGKCLKVKIED
ncbi:MAG: MerR family transcriptional regulator [Deltaproteobacteria bacterium]|nr:MerR family transcriptional regulator [Deltaproteobacteria bacterium]